MGLHSLDPEEEPYPEPTTDPNRIEAKVLVSSGVALALSGVIAALNAILADSSLLSFLPPFWQTVVITLVPPLLTFLAGYQTTSNRVPPADEGEIL